MDTNTTRTYRKLRRDDPLTPAHIALAIARSADKTYGWEDGPGETWTREQDGFELTLRVEIESYGPADGDGYGDYVEEIRGYTNPRGSDDWSGNYPEPAVDSFPLGLPYTAFRFEGPSRGESGYFIPSEIEEQFDYYRREGQSRTVALDLTRAWVERIVRDLFLTPLANIVVTVTASHEGIELGSAAMGSSVLDDTSHALELGDEIASEAIDEARTALAAMQDPTPVVYLVDVADSDDGIYIFAREQDADAFAATRGEESLGTVTVRRETVIGAELAASMIAEEEED